MVEEVGRHAIGSRVNNVYDINSKTYLLKLTKNEDKFVLLLESGARFHFTEFDWAKNMMPSGFSMKLRKHIKNKKITKIVQLGADRIIDIIVGEDVNAFHLIVELYDKGNMIFTDHAHVILHLLRPRTDANQDVRYAAHEKYPIDTVRQLPHCLKGLNDTQSLENIRQYVLILLSEFNEPWSFSNFSQALRPVQKTLASEFNFGQASIDHCCRLALHSVQSWVSSAQPMSLSGENVNKLTQELKQLFADGFSTALKGLLLFAYHMDGHDAPSPTCGYVFGKKRQSQDEELLTQDDFHPFLFDQFRTKAHLTFPSFSKAVDYYFSKIENQKTNTLLFQNETKAQRKIENIKHDHELRLASLKSEQDCDIRKAQLLETNQQLVDSIILMINHALSNQVDWRQLESIVEQARERGDMLAHHIVQLNLHSNQLILRLRDPFQDYSHHEEITHPDIPNGLNSAEVAVDLDLNALNNAQKYYDRKRAAVKKEERTIVASRKALKSAAYKADQIRTDMKTVAQVSKIRKPMWFEKFFWFISSENYLVVAGRDAQQNETLVKRHLGPDDVYVHADLHGASSVVVKTRPLLPNELTFHTGTNSGPEANRTPLPPLKTLTEAGTMAITLSSAWDARVVTSAWWVRQDQVSKTAPSGEYLTTGAFMIRGRKNYLPPCHFIYGFGILFKLDDESVVHHQGERRVTRAMVSSPLDFRSPLEVTESVMTPSALSDIEDSNSNIHAFPNTQLHLDISKLSGRFTSNCSLQPTDSTTARSRRKPPTAKYYKSALSAGPCHPTLVSDALTVHFDPPGSDRGPLKRGQKSKVKKIKKKYGEQDEDERRMRMKLLQGENAKLSRQHGRVASQLIVGPTVSPGSEGGTVDADTTVHDTSLDEYFVSEETVSDSPVTSICDKSALFPKNPTLSPHEIDDDVDAKPLPQNDWLGIMDTFTGQPLGEDVLLYALPVCAPYSALVSYKFKAKLTPGTLKRGKATKTLLNYFATHKSATKREQELLRVLRGEDVSRNFPGCVKISFPQDTANRDH